MQSKKWIFYLLIIISYCQCAIIHAPQYMYEDPEEPLSKKIWKEKPVSQGGECFAKCLIPEVYETGVREYVVYTGDETKEEVDLDYLKVITKQKRNNWIKKKSKNPRSYKSDVAYVWCLLEAPEEVEKIKVLTDTTQSKNYELRKIETEIVIQKGGFTEWRKIVCQENLTSSLLTDIQNALLKFGYYDDEITGKVDLKTKLSLTDFQKDNNLPIGNYDFETLKTLEVENY